MTKSEYKIAILQVIKSDGNIYSLIMMPDYDMFEEIVYLKKHDYVKESYGKMHLTSKGELLLNYLNKKTDRRGIYKYISPQYYRMIEKLKVEDNYIPSKKL